MKTQRRPLRDAAWTLAAVWLSFGASCASDGDNGGYDPKGGGYGSGGGGYDGSNAGDAYPSDNGRPNRIPPWADDVREGTGRVKWTADLEGTVYVYDRDADVIRYTGPVRPGDQLEVVPKDDTVRQNGRPVSSENLRRDGFHQIYFVGTGPHHDRDRYTPPPAPPAPVDTSYDVPSNAVPLDRGSDGVSVNDARHSGVVYVYDADARSVLLQTALRKHSSLKVVPRDGMVYMDGNAFRRVRFGRGHTLVLYFVDR